MGDEIGSDSRWHRAARRRLATRPGGFGDFRWVRAWIYARYAGLGRAGSRLEQRPRRRRRAAGKALRSAGRAVVSVWGELLTAAAILAGWACLTVAVVRAGAPADVVWPAALGILLLGAAGWRFTGHVLWAGLYTLCTTPAAAALAEDAPEE